MPVLSEKESYDGERSDSFIHMQNLPWSAGRNDIKDYFKQFPIKEGGILLRGKEAFVALEDPLDMVSALCLKHPPLHGCCVQLSAITKDELPKALMRCTRRKLDFGMPNQNGSMSFPRPEKRKIRPTPVLRNQKRRALSQSVFLSQEVNLPAPQYYARQSSVSRKKKMQPTKVPDGMKDENFAVFHPEQCYDLKNIRFGMQLAYAIET